MQQTSAFGALLLQQDCTMAQLTESPAINEAIEKAIAEGNTVEGKSAGWEKVREVVSMQRPLGHKLRDALSQDRRLRNWHSRATPHIHRRHSRRRWPAFSAC